MNQANRRLLMKAAHLLVTQAATLKAAEETMRNSDRANLKAALAYTRRFEQNQPRLFEMEAFCQTRSGDNEMFEWPARAFEPSWTLV